MLVNSISNSKNKSCLKILAAFQSETVYAIVYSSSGVAEVKRGRIATLECEIITCLWYLT